MWPRLREASGATIEIRMASSKLSFSDGSRRYAACVYLRGGCKAQEIFFLIRSERCRVNHAFDSSSGSRKHACQHLPDILPGRALESVFKSMKHFNLRLVITYCKIEPDSEGLEDNRVQERALRGTQKGLWLNHTYLFVCTQSSNHSYFFICN